ncbi:helix-turn-helix domain-containing protein [bacterium]|nr:helix-turn-helix domain-containing protein [bacterium]
MDASNTPMDDDSLREIRLPSLSNLFEHLPGVLFFAKNDRGQFIMANAAFAQRFGFIEPNQLVGKSDSDIFPAELIDGFRKKDQEIIQTGKPVYSIIELFPSNSGEYIWHETTKIPLQNHRGNPCGVCGIVRAYEGVKALVTPFLQVESAAEHIKNNLTNPLEVEKLAHRTGMSVRQFERKFRKAYRVSPRTYLVRMRVAAASDLLRETTLKPSDIAEKTGFYDASDFSRQFKAAMKLSPRDYRRLHQGRTTGL